MAKQKGSASLRGSGRKRAVVEAARDNVGYHAAWARWSASADELAELVGIILTRPAATISDLSIKFDALAWLLLADCAVLDHEAERQVRRFGRELRQLGATEGPGGGGLGKPAFPPEGSTGSAEKVRALRHMSGVAAGLRGVTRV